MGVTQGLKETGSLWSVVAKSGLWHSAAFRGYVAMSRDVELGAQHLFGFNFDSDSEEKCV